MKLCSADICTGCGACKAVCPVQAITMTADINGFLSPVINDKCTDCGLCGDICPPVKGQYEGKKRKSAFAVINKNTSERKTASSGGVFALLAREIISMGGVVYGAAFGKALRVVHTRAQSMDEVTRQFGSKYVQSDTDDSFALAKADLESGRQVLFSGTPCQIAGLSAYLEKPYDNLITVDVICHGVPSPGVLEKYISENFPDAEKISFRDKRKGWTVFGMSVVSPSGEYYRDLYRDPYMRLFLQNYSLRECCYDCRFKNGAVADITLGDFWGISRVKPSMNDDRGTSAVLINSARGRVLFDSIAPSAIVSPVEPAAIESINTALSVSAKRPYGREEFFKLLSDNTVSCLADRFAPPLKLVTIAVIKLKVFAKRMLGKLKNK